MSSVIRVTRQMAIVINRRLGLFSIALLFICIIGLEIQINRLQAKTIGKNSGKYQFVYCKSNKI